jgi:hypothetical protein
VLTSFPSKHRIRTWQDERTLTPSHCHDLVPIRAGKQEQLGSLQSSAAILRRRPLKPAGPRRPQRRHRSLFLPKGMLPVTVCATVLCTAGPQRIALIGISDRMVTWNDAIEYETWNRTKVFDLTISSPERGSTHPKIVAMGAGDIDAFVVVAERTREEATQNGITDVAEMARLFGKHFGDFRKERAEGLHLAPLGLTMQSFTENQRGMLPRLVLDLEERLQSVKLGVAAIIAGVDSSPMPHMYVVGRHVLIEDGSLRESAEPVCQDHTGFCAVGSGAELFEIQLMLRRYDWSCPLADAILLTYAAKKQAESAVGVGQLATDMLSFMDGAGQVYPDSSPFVQAVKEHHQRFEKTVAARLKTAVNKMKEDTRIIEHRPPSPQSNS